MTLIIGVAYKDEFALVSTDSKVTTQGHDPYNFKEIGEVMESDSKSSKIDRLTDNVFFVHAGIQETSVQVDKELRKRINKNDDLESCSKILQEVTDHLYNNERKTFEEVGLNNMGALSLNFIGTEHFTCYLFGFFKNGKTGLAYINPETIKVEMIESPIDQGFQAVIISPSTEDSDNYLNWVNIPAEEQTFENFTKQIYLIHAKLSHKHSNSVSSDFNLHAMIKDGNEIKHYTDKIDTSELYPMFEGNPGIDYSKTYKIYKS